MKNKEIKRKVLIYSTISVFIVGIVIFLVVFITNSKNEYSFTEKSWINDNVNNVIDISVPTDYPVFSMDGKGLFLDFIDNLESDTNLKFNIINSNADYSFKTKNNLSENDLLIFRDHFVVFSTSEGVLGDLKELQNQKVAVLTDDMSLVSDYINNISNINYTTYASYSEIENAFKSGTKYAILPLYKYMNKIVYHELYVSYHLDGLNNYYVLSMPNSDNKLNSILNKFLVRWQDELRNNLNKNLLELYYTAHELTEIEKETILNDDYIVAYIDNLPYEGKINRNFSGITNGYLAGFSEFAGTTYKYVEYKNINNLNKSLSKKKVDIVYNNGNLANNNYTETISLGKENYVVLVHQSNNLSVNNINSLKGKTVKGIANTNLTRYLETNNIKVEKYDNYKKLIKNISEEDIIVVEKESYEYFKTDKMKEFSIRYMGETVNMSNFLLNSDNKVFNDLFKFYINTISKEEIKLNALNLSLIELNSNIILNFMISNISYILILIFAITLFFYLFNKKIKITKKIKREDKLMYLDVMTNLKNRNFLNENIDYWEANKVYPQAIVVVDLNKIKEINDIYGHEEGDNQIKAAANILIKTQRENSEIIRTDGNEFLIYLVGYEEKIITTYMHKLNKEFNSLPKNYGVSMGYSMIEDEIKTIDDAINEALIMMRKNKGE